MAKWEAKTLAESGIISAVGEQATAAIEGVSAVLELIAGGAEIAKLFLSALGNPLAALIKALADEIIKALNDYKNLGFFALVINPFDETMEQNNKLHMDLKWSEMIMEIHILKRAR